MNIQKIEFIFLNKSQRSRFSSLKVIATGFLQARLCKIQGLLKYFPTVFNGLKTKKNTDLHVKILLLKC